MRTRTKLTTPPGEEPVSSDTSPGTERYAPGFDVPSEPAPPRRRPFLPYGIALIVVAALIGLLLVRATTAGQSEDPALDRQPLESTTP